MHAGEHADALGSNDASASLPYEVSLTTTYWGTLPELSELLDLARRGLVKARVQRFGLDEAADAYDKLGAGELEGRAVIVP